ncbi:hypothetical protein BDZ94DRAFT_1303297 [Collybia nuda]|uniref:NAD(P)-binding protein n=1 Tax=Collybia nuda TaxID=64659 RepID=A0A9P6CR27_9AGAR|nr:hypothetical protein BDZ94DRAFT_1303297 [Collybia nuda]
MPSYVITGASRGIGFEFVRQISEDENNTVFGIVRNPATAKELTSLKRPNVHVLKSDVTDHRGLSAAAAEVAKITGGSLDYLINNAAAVNDEFAHLTLTGFEDQDVLAQSLRGMFNVNVVGVVFTINAFLPLLQKGSVKKVITISSGVADLDLTVTTGIAASAPYSISKAGVNLAVGKYAAQFKSEGFIFLALSPGLVDTSTKPPTPEELEGYKQMITAFKQYDTTFEGAITPEQSVKMQLAVINNVTVKDTGAFISHHGDKRWL